MISTSPFDAFKINSPSRLVVVPTVVPFTLTAAPITGSLVFHQNNTSDFARFCCAPIELTKITSFPFTPFANEEFEMKQRPKVNKGSALRIMPLFFFIIIKSFCFHNKSFILDKGLIIYQHKSE